MFVVSLKCVFEWSSHSASVSLIQGGRLLRPSHRHVDRDDQCPAPL